MHNPSSLDNTLRLARTATLIWNPRAGRGARRRVANQVEEFCGYLERRGIAVDKHPTTCPGDATHLAHAAILRGCRDIIVAGGDGTLNEVLQSLVGRDGVRLGIWARGTANVLARELNLPFDPHRAADVIAANHTRDVHVGCAISEIPGAGAPLQRYFFLMAGIGLDAAVVSRVSSNLKRHTGEAAFWYAGLEHLARWQPARFQIEVAGETLDATFAAVGKAPRYGGGLRVTPGARLEEPRFQLCIINSGNRFRCLRLLAATFASEGIGTRHTDATLLHAQRLRAFDANHTTLVQLDGELAGTLPMTFEAAAHPITVFASH